MRVCPAPTGCVSPWRTQGGLPWQGRFSFGTMPMRRPFPVWRRPRAIRIRFVVSCSWQRAVTLARAVMRPSSAASVCRRFAIGCFASRWAAPRPRSTRSLRVISKVIDNHPFDGPYWPPGQARREARCRRHRASAATRPGGQYGPPKAAFLCPLAALRSACGARATARSAPSEQAKAQRSNG